MKKLLKKDEEENEFYQLISHKYKGYKKQNDVESQLTQPLTKQNNNNSLKEDSAN